MAMNAKRKAPILILTDEFDAHADIMVQILGQRDEYAVRFDPAHFPESSNISIKWSGSNWSRILNSTYHNIDLDQVKSIWLRRPSVWQPSNDIDGGHAEFIKSERNLVIHGLWKSLSTFWVNHPDCERTSDYKPYQLSVASDIGFRIPKTLITNDPLDAISFYNECNSNIVYKTLSSSEYEYLGKPVYTSPVSESHIKHINKIQSTPSLFQEYIPKQFEVRSTVIGDQIYSVAIFSQKFERTKYDWRTDTDFSLDYAPFELPKDISGLLMQLINSLGLVFGAVDMIVTPEGEYVFLEINPSGQFGFVEMRTGLPLFSAMADLLIRGSKP